MKFKSVSKEEEEKICQEYAIDNVAVNDIAIRHKLGAIRIRQILKDNGITNIDKSKEKTNKRFEKERDLSQCLEGYHSIAVCKIDGKKFNDVMNYGGFLHKHLRELGIEIPPYYQRRMHFNANKKYWFEEYYDIIQVKNEEAKPTKKCPYCKWETVDIENKSGAFLVHLRTAHNLDKIQYLQEHPEDVEYFAMANQTANLQHSLDENEFVICQICGKKLRRIDSKHLANHGITKQEYIAKYGNETLAKTTLEKLQGMAFKMNQKLQDSRKFSSKAETEIIEFLQSNGIECKKDRIFLKGRELDVFIPQASLAIEYDGIIWHSKGFGGKEKDYHSNKTKLCQENGVQLIHIFEDEYSFKKDAVNYMLLNKLGIKNKNKTISAHKCSVSRINKEQALDFVSVNNLDIISNAVQQSGNLICYGAFLNNQLVGVIVLEKQSDTEFELLYTSTLYTYKCYGVIGKLFKAFEQEFSPKKVISQLDLRFSNIRYNICTRLGFKFRHATEPTEWYFYKHQHRPKRMRKEEMDLQQDHDTIFDCGNAIYVKEYS